MHVGDGGKQPEPRFMEAQSRCMERHIPRSVCVHRQKKIVQLTGDNPVPSARLKSQFSERTQQAGEAGVDEWKDIMAMAKSDIRYTTMLQRINNAITNLDSTNGWTPCGRGSSAVA